MSQFNKVRILVFDTKTAGTPKHYRPAHEDIDNYPDLLQFSAKLVDIDLNDLDRYEIVYSMNMLIKPERQVSKTLHRNVVIEDKAFEEHGITTDKLNILGDDIFNVAMIYQGLTNSADFIISHNYTLHKNVMVSELMRLGIRARYSKRAKVLCMMKYASSLLAIPTTRPNQYKFPTPSEVFNKLTGQEASEFFDLKDADKDTDLYIVNLLQLLKQQNELFSWLNGDIEELYPRKIY